MFWSSCIFNVNIPRLFPNVSHIQICLVLYLPNLGFKIYLQVFSIQSFLSTLAFFLNLFKKYLLSAIVHVLWMHQGTKTDKASALLELTVETQIKSK